MKIKLSLTKDQIEIIRASVLVYLEIYSNNDLFQKEHKNIYEILDIIDNNMVID